MSNLATRIVGFVSRTSKGLRSLRSLGNPQARLQASTRQAELEGLQFAFYARLTAIIIVSVVAVLARTLATRSLLRRLRLRVLPPGLHPVPPAAPSSRRDDQAWLHRSRRGLGDCRDPGPASGRVSAPNGPFRPGCAARNFSTFSFSSQRPPSPTRQDGCVWTGVSILVIWSIGVFTIYSQPDTLRFNDAAAEGALTSAAVLDLSFSLPLSA